MVRKYWRILAVDMDTQVMACFCFDVDIMSVTYEQTTLISCP